ncbi:hypothetical protein KHS38_06630 [Mucilaginibacter sp. Bleaf8]|uniref:hypothetical protein n=1 Tax=Mucilaginibacter sp. Bleaf8 TaxID=2834430 RepID=UPI001BCE4E28|nr:hypothetical protein [Mucilaginibacter sp. Bleaf8]MBS7564077.1 hypothetical protein [Mucilaginibacter sp. Bleaf8]
MKLLAYLLSLLIPDLKPLQIAPVLALILLYIKVMLVVIQYHSTRCMEVGEQEQNHICWG